MMTNERLLHGGIDVGKFIPRFSSPFGEKDAKAAIVKDIDDQDRLMVEKTPKDRSPSAIERLLDTLKLSPKLPENSQVNDRDKPQEPDPITVNANRSNSWSTSGHLANENRKQGTISPSRSDYPETETYDSLSDSTYSQSSETSGNSDLRSLNATSTDSDNNRIFQRGIAPRDQSSLKNNTDVIDVDEGFLRRVLMLMKVVLYLRHSFPLKIIRRRKVFPESARNQIGKFHDSSSVSSTGSGDSHGSSVFSGKSPRVRKRISFSPITLLFSAITERAYAEAEAILEEQELDVNSQTPNGQSLLHIAAVNADLKCVQLLLQYGADVNAKDTNGWSPLHAAVRGGNWKCAILLIEAGADFGEYAQARIQEYNQVLQMSTTFYRSVEIFV